MRREDGKVNEASASSGLDHMTSVFDPMVVSIVCTHAARLAGRHGFSFADRDDIRQELFLDCFVRLRRFDSTKSSRRTFVYRVVRHRLRTLHEYHSAACRDYRLCIDSLDSPAPFAIDESITLGDSLSTGAYEARIGRQALSPWQREELRIDVNKAISTLPCELALIANLLRSLGIVEVAQELGIPRATLYRRIDSIRKAFELAGLNFYLGDQSTKSLIRRGGRTRASRRRSADLAPRRVLEGQL